MTSLEAIEAYPLQWPTNWPRTNQPKRSQFGVQKSQGWGQRYRTVAEARTFLLDELRRLGVDTNNSIVISTNIRTRNDGLPYSNAAEPDDSGVAVYFKSEGELVCIPCDTYDRVADNLYAVGKVIEALRAIERHGSDMLQAAYTGFKALPEQAGGSAWYDVLDIEPDSTEQEIKKAYRDLVKIWHPDKPEGDRRHYELITEARNQGLEVVYGRRN